MPHFGPLTRRQLFDLARLAADRHGEALSLPTFCRETGLCESRLYSLVDSWAEVRAAIGLSPKRPGRRVYSDAVLLAEYDRVVRTLGHPPSGAEFTRIARMNYETLRRRFGSLPEIKRRHREYVARQSQDNTRRAPERTPDWLRRIWRERTVAFHVRSSDAQGRPLHLCDLIVCLEHDWPICPCPALELHNIFPASGGPSLASGGRQSPDPSIAPKASRMVEPESAFDPANITAQPETLVAGRTIRDAGITSCPPTLTRPHRGTDVPRSPNLGTIRRRHTGNRRRHPLTPDELIDRVRELAADTDERLTLRRFTQQTGIPEQEIYRHFTSWTDARLAAGLPRSTRTGSRYGPDELLSSYDAVVTRLGKLPTIQEFNRLAPMNYQTLACMFGSRDQVIAAYTAWRAGDVSPPMAAGHPTGPTPQIAHVQPTVELERRETRDASGDSRPPLAEPLNLQPSLPDPHHDDARLRTLWQSVRLSFQTDTSDFTPSNARYVDLLVVWEDDADDPPVPILELSRLWPWLKYW